MRPPDDVTEEDLFGPVEALLRGAAEFEPDEPAPGLLTAGGVALLLASDAARRRRTIQARVATIAGVLTAAAACSASLVLALNQPRPVAQAPQAPSSPISQQAPAPRPAQQVVTASAPVAPQHRAQTVAFIRHSPRPRPRQRPETPAPPVWTDETVEQQVTGVLAQAWLVQPHEDGSFEVTPTVVDVPLPAGAAACEPAIDPADAPPAPDDLNLKDNEAR